MTVGAGPGARRAARAGSRRLWPRCRGGGPACSAAVICVRVSLAAAGRVGGLGQQFQGVGAGQRQRVGGQGGGEVVAQRGPQPQHVAGAFPDQRLMGAGDDLDRLGLRRCPPATGRSWWRSVRTMSASVCASALSLLAPDNAIRLPVAGRPVWGSPRRPGSRPRPAPAPTAPGRSRYTPSPAAASASSAQVLRDQLVEPGHPVHALGQPRRGHRPARARPAPPRRGGLPPSRRRRTALVLPSSPGPLPAACGRPQRPNGPVLTPPSAGTTPHQPSLSRPQAGARSHPRTHSGPGGGSAHPPAATRHRVCQERLTRHLPFRGRAAASSTRRLTRSGR